MHVHGYTCTKEPNESTIWPEMVSVRMHRLGTGDTKRHPLLGIKKSPIYIHVLYNIQCIHVHVHEWMHSPYACIARTIVYTHTGQFYSLFCKANSSAAAPELVKSVVYLTFFDEPDSRVELNNWQYWYSQQANPNQKAFDIGQFPRNVSLCTLYMYTVCAHSQYQ